MSDPDTGQRPAQLASITAHYRDLTPVEADLLAQVDAIGQRLAALTGRIEATLGADRRWCAIGKTDLQHGVMSLRRAIVAPEGF